MPYEGVRKKSPVKPLYTVGNAPCAAFAASSQSARAAASTRQAKGRLPPAISAPGAATDRLAAGGCYTAVAVPRRVTLNEAVPDDHSSPSDALLGDQPPSVADQPLSYVLVLVHPAEGVNPLSTAEALRFAMCGCEGAGTAETPEVLSRRRAIHARMRAVGLLLDFQLSRDGDEVLVKVKAPEAMLEAAAERIGLEKRLITGGYADFTLKQKGRFSPALGSPSIFTSRERIRLLLSILAAPKESGGCAIDMDDELASGTLTALVPIHDPLVTSRLMKTWVGSGPSLIWSLRAAQPVDEIRDYFGEQVALYFAFAGHVTGALLWPTLIGGGVYAASFYYGSMDNPISPLYSGFVLLWATWLCKSWTREQVRLAYHWSVEDFEETEPARPEFVGPPARGFYNDEGYFVDIDNKADHSESVPLIKKFTPEQRSTRAALSWLVIIPMIISVVVGTFSVLAFRSSLQMRLFYMRHFELPPVPLVSHGQPIELDVGEEIDPSFWQSYAPSIGSGIGGGLNAAFIVLMNSVYASLAGRLNEWENHRTETEYQDALIIKTFVFQFINSYVALFYIGFIKAGRINILGLEGGEYCHDLSRFDVGVDQLLAEGHGVDMHCMDELGAYLSFVLTFSRVLSIGLEWALPAGNRAMGVWLESAGLRQSLKRALRQGDDLRAIKARTPWALDFAKRVMRRGGGANGNGANANGAAAKSSAPVFDTSRISTAELPSMSPYEEQAKLEAHGGVFAEYNSIIINLGYVILFAPAFPIAAAICYATFLFELRADAYKHLATTRRPTCEPAEDIGSWLKVLWLLSTIAVFTNVSLVGFTSAHFQSMLPISLFNGTVEITVENKAVCLFLVEHVFLGAQYFVANVLPDLPRDTSVQRALGKWRARAATEKLAGTAAPAKEEWDDKKIPRRFFATINGNPLTAPAPAIAAAAASTATLEA